LTIVYIKIYTIVRRNICKLLNCSRMAEVRQLGFLKNITLLVMMYLSRKLVKLLFSFQKIVFGKLFLKA